jgi:hypothetical protein
MRLAPGRALAACLLSGGYLVWSLVGGTPAIPAAAALTASGAALAATSSQCEPLPSAATPSPTATTQAELCVSVQASQSGITRGQAASYTVQVWAANGSASGVSVTLTGSPQGEEPEFTARCPSGDGSATCTIGSLATAVTPSSYQMQAQIAVASGTTSVTSVTLTATADAATTPALTVLPAAAETVTVSAPTAAASTPPASRSSTSTPSPSASPATVPAVAATPTIGTSPTTPAGVGSSLISPVGAATVLPVTSTPVTPAVGPIAATGALSASSFTLVIPASTAELLGFIVLGLVVLFAVIKLARHRLAGRRAQEQEGAVKKQRRFWPPWPPGRWRAAAPPGSEDAPTATLAEDTESVVARSRADPATEDQS